MKKKFIIVISILAILVVGYLVINSKKTDNNNVNQNEEIKAAAAYVTIDINPSIELAVDQNDIVLDVVTLNEDADIAYSDLNLIGETLEDASQTIVDAAIETGYINEISDTNAVDVTTYTEDETLRQKLNKKVVDRLNTYLETRKVYALVVENGLDDELKARADSYSIYGISYGKMLLISRAMQLDSTLIEGDLVTMSVKDIQSKIKAQQVARREEVKAELQKAKLDFKEVKTQKVNEARLKLKQAKEALLKDVPNASSLTEEQKNALINQRKEQIRNEIKGLREELKQDGSNIKQEIRQNIQQKYLNKNR